MGVLYCSLIEKHQKIHYDAQPVVVMEYIELKSILATLLLFFTGLTNAGVVAFTMHSRANCVGFNESISWHLGYSYWLRTKSQHIYDSQIQHTVDTGKEYTWRSAAYHVGDSFMSGWSVRGLHYGYGEKGQIQLYEITYARDCSIYDGWWDH